MDAYFKKQEQRLRTRMHRHTHTPTERARGTLTFSRTPESSLMANLRENNHFSSVFERQVGAFYVPAVKQH